jgi:hypothetical protein
MISSKRMNFWLVLVLAVVPAGKAAAQNGTPYTLDQVLGLVQDVPGERILQMVKGSCIDFRLSSANLERLRAAGADKDLLAGLRSTCNKADSRDSKDSGGGTDTKRTNIRRDPTPPPRKRPVVTPPAVTPQPVTPYNPPVYTPPVTNDNTQGTIDWDFRTSQPLTAGKFNNCQYDYSPAGYTLRVLEYGGSCLDGSMQEWESNVHLSTVAVPVSGNAGYTYGLRFGISDDTTVGYYALEVSSYGHFQLSRYRYGKWEVVVPWQTGTGINASSANTIAADIRGSTVNFIINGINQYTFHAPAEVRGRVGFGIIGFDKAGPYPVVTFRTFSVSGQKGTSTTPVTPTPVTPTPSTASVDWDFSSSQPLSTGLFGKCRYDYASGGYQISVDQPGSTCLDGPSGDQPANVRVSVTGRGVRGGTGYTYGLRLGYTTDQSIGYYAVELSEGGSFQLSRKRNDAWEPLNGGWQHLSVVNPASSGAANVITAEIRGATVTVYVNGTQVSTYTGTNPIVGPVSFGVIGYDQTLANPVVVFTRFSVTPLSGNNTVTTVTPTPVTPTPSTASVDWDFTSSQPLSTGLYGKCRYDYANGGYTVAIDQPGSTCLDGPSGDQPASVRISTTARGVRGGTGYTYGLRLGYTTDQSIGYYAVELSEGGSFQLSRKRNDVWEPLNGGWQHLSVVNTAASGVPNVITAEIRGATVTVYVNGTQVSTYTGTNPIVGPAGFGVIGYDQTLANPAVVFTRFSVTPLY